MPSLPVCDHSTSGLGDVCPEKARWLFFIHLLASMSRCTQSNVVSVKYQVLDCKLNISAIICWKCDVFSCYSIARWLAQKRTF